MYDIEFWNSVRLTEFWDMVGGLLKFVSPGVLITVAIIGVGMLLTIVINAFKQGAEDDDDKDYEIKHYD